MEKYNIDILEKEKILKIELIGDITPEGGDDFLTDFLEAHEDIIPSQYKIFFNLGCFELYPIDVEEVLKPFFLLYKQNNYELIMMELFTAQKELMYQMTLLAQKVGLTRLEFRFID